MAEGVLSNIAGEIIKSLASLVGEEIGLLWSVRNELEKLQGTVSTIKGMLLQAERLQDENPGVRDWLERLNDAIYDAEDLLDAVSSEVLQRQILTQDKMGKKVRIFFSRSNQLVYGFRMGHKIKLIREKLNAIKGDRQFLLEDRRQETRVRDWRRDNTYSHLGAEIIIGREDDKMAVISRLMEPNIEGNVLIMAIVGLGGLGKTTLAQLVFNNVEIQNNFELKIWVCISDNFDFEVIVKKILECITKKKPKTDLMETLLGDLQNEMKGKKYLLVMDDIWNEDDEKWSKLKNQLMVGAKGSKILITTRKENVARIMHAKPYHLGGLKEDASWELFKQVAFENGIGLENLSIEKMEKMGREILKRCFGVPLVVKVIGRLLCFKRLEVEWQNFIKEELPKISQKTTDILQTLKLSYNDLPSHLKHCFAYCSLFPKNYVFDKATLINLWIAQGYVESKENQCLEEIGHDYFMNLYWRSFFQEARVDGFGDIIKCKMHDLMHDLAISVARPLITTFPSKDSINYKKTRHIAIAYDTSSYFAILSSLYNANLIRTFLFSMANESYHPIEIDCEAIVKSFKFLRVLDLSRRKLKYVPNSIGKLKHLRYLSLSNNEEIKELPRSITKMVNLQYLCLSKCKQFVRFPKGFERLFNLKHLDVGGCGSLRCMPDEMGQLTNLQMLDVRGCLLLKELPRDITKLVNLRFLYMDILTRLECMPHGFGKLTNLQELSRFMVDSSSSSQDSGGLDELYGLNNLRGHLAIEVVSCGKDIAKEYEVANLKDKQNLDSLRVVWKSGVINDFDDDVSLESLQPHLNLKRLTLVGNRCSRHPSWLLLLTNLVSLELNRCTKWQYLSPLSRLPFLKDLSLRQMDGMEYISNCDEWNDFSSSSLTQKMFFPSLKEISFYKCPNLKGWWRNSPTEVESLLLSFPLLSRLWIYDCPMLASMPMFLHLKELLRLKNTNWKPLQQTLMMNTSVTTTSSVLSCTPLSKLKELELHSIKDLEILSEEGLQNLTSLKILKFEDCYKLKSLSPGIRHLTTIQRLDICNCPIFVDEENEMQWQGLRSLFDLSFRRLPKLSSLPLGLQHVITLKKLKISKCESLTTLSPVIQHLSAVEELDIEDCPMCVDDENGMQWQGLKSLLSLTFWNLPKLSSPPLGLQHVTTLKKLRISSCESLTTLFPVIQHLIALEELDIGACPLYVDDENGMQWQGLQSLLSLSFWNLPKLSSLPLGLEHVTTLKNFRISNCENLTTIAEWIHQYKSLEVLSIRGCPSLASLPIGKCEPWSLRRLDIWRCPILSQKCGREKGEYWPKIAHIPELYVDE